MFNVIALGAETKTTFSSYSDNGIFTGSVADDLNDINSYKMFEKAVREYIKKNNFKKGKIVCDMHPDYRSSLLAEEIIKELPGSELLKVQHHFAHIAGCMLDNDLDGEVIGISFDGTGYGADGKSWGGEFLTCSRKSFKRVYHFEYVHQPGGDVASREAWRMAVSYCYNAFGADFKKHAASLIERIGRNKVEIVEKMIFKNVNASLTSSVGRLFDAVSSILGVCDVSSFEAEAAILLEKAAGSEETSFYDYEILEDKISVSKMIKEIVLDMEKGVDKGVISAKFHNTLGEIIFDISKRINKETGLEKVLISGGCFQNKYLVDYLERRFEKAKLKLFKHKNFSPTDAGVSIGQAVVASSL